MAGTSDDEPSIDPFNDPFWLPFEQVHQLLRQQYGHPQVTAVEMGDGFAIDVPTMKRSRMYWADREMLSFEYWNEHDLVWSDDHLVLVSCPPRPLYKLGIPESFVGYAWLPALVKRWPVVFGPMLPKPPQQPQLQKPQPGAPKLEQSQSEELKPPPPGSKAEIWVHYAVRQWPRRKDEGAGEYVNRLLTHAPRRWARHTIQNALSGEGGLKDKKNRKAKSRR
jgi:hypothetical protein